MTTLDEIAGHAESTRASVKQIIGKIIKSGAIACVRRGSKSGTSDLRPGRIDTGTIPELLIPTSAASGTWTSSSCSPGDLEQPGPGVC